MGQRMVGRVEPPVPAVLRRVQLLPVLTPVALSLAAIVGDDAVALVPISSSSWLHAALAIVGGAILGGAVYLGSTLLQRRMMAEVQALASPKG
jgi:hypothetical protein